MRFLSTFVLLTFPLLAKAAPLSYNRDIRPILSENCFACHGPDKASREAKLRLDVREVALKKDAIVPGDPEESELIYLINTDDEDDLMPPPDSHKSLTAAEKNILEEWIAQGAPYEPHWAYIKPERPAIPEMGAVHPIDNFILARLKPEKLVLSPPADKNTLARRLAFDLTGLPPSSVGLADSPADLDALLASPHFGERMAVYWLDLARYADTAGYHSDKVRDVTPYRDYVIKAFNDNKPYDEFIVEQLAGDLMPEPSLEQYVATTFNRVNQVSEEGGIQDKEYIAKYYSERVRTTSVAFLGSTMGCAECHDHKFDPFTAKDFYAMEAFFSDIFEKGAYNGDGRFNEGADIKNYPGFTLTQWGPTMLVPEEGQGAELAKLVAKRIAAEAELQETTPALEAAFADWVKEIKGKVAAGKAQDVTVLEDDEFPLGGAKTVTENVHSGSLARRQQGEGAVQHIVDLAKKPTTIAEGDTLFAWVWLDPENPPKQLMLQFKAGNDWNRRAWWGEDLLPFGQGRRKIAHNHLGKLPLLGKWTRLEVPVAAVGLSDGQKVTSLAFNQFGGTVLWDLVGRHTDSGRAALAGFPDPVRKAVAASKDKALTTPQKELLFAHYRTIAPALESVRKKIAACKASEKAAQDAIRTTLVTLSATPREIRLLPRGDWTDGSGDVLLPAVPEFLASDLESGSERLTRLDLAQWIASPDNPLTARAFANRVWALFFGSGLSRDLQDLGNQGQWPTHPELLDWLSVEFMESGWDVKHLVKLIVTSQSYQQSSNASAELVERDPYNMLYAHQNSRRLPAEFVRDNALAVSGLLNAQLGGASARPYQPAGYYAQLNFPKRKYQQHNDANQYRRGLYMHWQRSFLHPMLSAFDAPAREECAASRANSNTPLQALNLLNDPTFVEAARVFAEELVKESPELSVRLESGFRRLLSRSPSGEEVEILTALYDDQRARYRDAPEDAAKLLGVGLSPVAENLAPAELAAMTSVTRALLNLHETITRY